MTIKREDSYEGQLRKLVGSQRLIIQGVRGILINEKT